MILGIDASNIKSGGGLNHIIYLLKFYQNNKNFKKVIIWTSSDIQKYLDNKKNIIKKTNYFLNKNIVFRIFWQIFLFPFELRNNGCDILFQPGATFTFANIKKVSMCQNLLPFSNSELLKFGFSFFSIKILILRFFQTSSFLNSNGIIFLSSFSKNIISKKINLKKINTIIVPHGVDKNFYFKPKVQFEVDKYNHIRPFKFLYVSDLWPYKNHENILKAFAKLKEKKYPIEIHLVGDIYRPYFKKINLLIKQLDPEEKYIYFHGKKSNKQLISYYQNSNGFIFGSSCESYGQIISEAMMSGLPIICSNKSSMKEILKNNSFYFNPLEINSIKKNIIKFLNSPDIRADNAKNSQLIVKKLTWEQCSKKSFSFISNVGSM